MDFSDVLHLAGSTGADPFATFDRKLVRKAGMQKDVVRVLKL